MIHLLLTIQRHIKSVKCIACSRLHWVNARTGRVLEPTGKHKRY